jgi:hypothetical protein
VAFVPLAQVAHQPHRHVGHRAGVVLHRVGHARDGDIDIADGLDPLAAELLADPVEGGVDVVEFADDHAGIDTLIHVAEAGEIDRQHRDRLVEPGRHDAEGLVFLVDRARHHVQQQLFDLLLLALQLARVALDHHRIAVDHRFQLADAGDVLADQHRDALAVVQRQRHVHRHHHRAPAQLEGRLGGEPPALGQRRLQRVESRPGNRSPSRAPASGAPNHSAKVSL